MFILKETFKIIARSKLHFFITLISLSISVFLIVVSFFLFYTSEAIDRYLQDNLSINVFIKDDINDKKLQELENILLSKPYTAKLEYISKEKAYDIFLEETGEDFKRILDVNPLPASFDLYLKREFINKDSLNKIIPQLTNIPEVTEVVSKLNFYEKIFSTSKAINNYIILITILMIFTSIYLVFSTNKLIINSNFDKYETMKLVGAKLSSIKLPILLNNIFIGIIAGLISIGIIYLIISFLELNLQSILGYLRLDLIVLLISILLLGPFLGFVTSLISLRKITLKIKTH